MAAKAHVEGLGDFAEAWARAEAELTIDLAACADGAAQAGIEAYQANHPYTDRTGLLSGIGQDGPYHRPGRRSRWQSTTVIEFEAPYANIVNDGSKTARPYPFVPIIEAGGVPELERLLDGAIDLFLERLGGTE